MTDTSCCVPGCPSSTKRSKKVSWHTFPSDPDLRKRWTKQMRTALDKKWKLRKSTKICGMHFNPSGHKSDIDEIPLYFPLPSSCKKTSECISDILEEHNYCIRPEHILELRNSLNNMGIMMRDINAKMQKTMTAYKMQRKALTNALKERHNLKSQRRKFTKIPSEKTFTFSGLSNNANALKFYTGFDNVKTFNKLVFFLKDAYSIQAMRGKFRSSTTMEVELFLTLSRLKLGYIELKLIRKLGVVPEALGKMWEFWIYLLHRQFLTISLLSNKNTEIMLDVIKIKNELTMIDKPDGDEYKGLIAITPNGTICFISSLYLAGMSDQRIAESCGVLKSVAKGDCVYADTGFLIPDKDTALRNRKLIFMGMGKLMSRATLRIKIEQVIRSIKNYKILESYMSDDEVVRQKIWKICCYLLLFSQL